MALARTIRRAVHAGTVAAAAAVSQSVSRWWMTNASTDDIQLSTARRIVVRIVLRSVSVNITISRFLHKSSTFWKAYEPYTHLPNSKVCKESVDLIETLIFLSLI